MQHSPILGSSLSPNTRSVPVSHHSRARSSLDTFLIPGRIRVPSTKPRQIDLAVAHNLLRRNMVRTVNEQSASPAGEKAIVVTQTGRTPSSSHPSSPKTPNEPPLFLHPIHYESAPDTPSRGSPAPRASRQHAMVHIRPRQKAVQHGRHPYQAPAPPSQGDYIGTYDGAPESNYETRMTSVTWSSVSHRIFTDSSGSSQGVGPYEALNQYNHLAARNGIRKLKNCPGDTQFEEKTTRKVHHNGWLARKIFRRSSSTFSLEVKTSQRPVTRKMSLAKIPKLGDGERKSILHDKSLEEMSRLGGLGLFSLPPEFAVDKMTLPTCLSAVAAYLFQEGRNMPGLFRLSGQTTIVNQLYDFYAYQFSQAGSPSKVRETIGSGLLPAHLEYSIHDVASFFKKVLISLPGGLLGSLELFDAFRTIFFHLNPDPEVSDVEADKIRAKLVALAITSVMSQYRFYLIQAVLGLFAYLAHEAEAEKARSRERAAATEGKERNSSSELMGYQSLGVVLGPLLLGKMMDSIDLTPPTSEDGPRNSTESSRKAAEEAQRTSVGSKLDRDAILSAHVERANLTANVMELLLMLWKEVIVQLQKINTAGHMSPPPQDPDARLKRRAKARANRLSLRGSEEDLMFLSVLRGRPLPDDLEGPVKSKRRVKITSRSPVSRPLLSVSESDLPREPSRRKLSGGIGLEENHDQNVDDRSRAEESQVSEAPPPLIRKTVTDSSGSVHSGLREDQRSKSDIAMEQMAMGTILPSLHDSPITPWHNEPLFPVLPLRAKTSERDDVSSNGARNRVASNAPRDSKWKTEMKGSFFNKPLPIIGRAQLAEQSSRLSDDDDGEPLATSATFPARDSSLPPQKKLPPRPMDTATDTNNERPGERNDSVSSTATGFARKLGEHTAGSMSPTSESNSGNVKFLDHRFAEASRANRKAQEKDKGLVRIFAHIQDKEAPQALSGADENPFDDPSTKTSPPRNTLIPRPIQDVGSARRILNKSPSPPKNLSPNYPKGVSSTSYFDSSRETECSDVPSTTGAGSPLQHETFARKSLSDTSLMDRVEVRPARSGVSSGNFLDVTPTRPRSAYSSESLRRTPTEEDPPMALPTSPAVTRAISVDVNAQDHGVTASLQGTGSPRPQTVTLGRSHSMNTTLLDEIVRLKRLLEQKSTELDSTKRSLDAIRNTREGVSPNRSTPGGEGMMDQATTGAGNVGSVEGSLSEEVRVLRKEKTGWKKRAEWAEAQLAALEDQDEDAGQAATKD